MSDQKPADDTPYSNRADMLGEYEQVVDDLARHIRKFRKIPHSLQWQPAPSPLDISVWLKEYLDGVQMLWGHSQRMSEYRRLVQEVERRI